MIDVKNNTVFNKILKPWSECAHIKDCINPIDADRTLPNADLTHCYDQSVLNILLSKNSISLTAREGETLQYGRQSTSCVVRGSEIGSFDPFELQQPKEYIEGRDGKMFEFCGELEWLEGSAISCHERAAHMMKSYKMSDKDAKISILEQGCACVDVAINQTSQPINTTTNMK